MQTPPPPRPPHPCPNRQRDLTVRHTPPFGHPSPRGDGYAVNCLASICVLWLTIRPPPRHPLSERGGPKGRGVSHCWEVSLFAQREKLKCVPRHSEACRGRKTNVKLGIPLSKPTGVNFNKSLVGVWVNFGRYLMLGNQPVKESRFLSKI